MAIRTYLVTGSASGIGAATVALLRGEGQRVIGVDVRDADVVGDLGTDGGRLAIVRALPELGGSTLDGVIACAGVTARTPAIVRVNFFGVTELLRRVRPMLVAAPQPRAVVVSSLAAIHPVDVVVVEACLAGDEDAAVQEAIRAIAAGGEHALYASTKAALSRWVRRSAPSDEWAGAGIALNAVCPGTVRTPMTAALLANSESRHKVDEIVPMPLGGYLAPETVARALIWLAAPENTHITGQCLFVDGGADAVLRADAVW